MKDGVVAFYSNASYEQVVTVNGLNRGPLVFSGSGEDNHPMKSPSGSSMIKLSASDSNKELSIHFQYKAPDGTIHDANEIQNNPTSAGAFRGEIVTSEDSTDDDINDSVVIINCRVGS